MTLLSLVAVSLIALIPPMAAGAQSPSSDGQLPAGVSLGATVRVWSPELRRSGRDAVLDSWTVDSLALLPPGMRSRDALGESRAAASRQVVSQHSVSRIDLRVRRTRGEGARAQGLLGLGVGAVTGGLLELGTRKLGAESWPLPIGIAAGAAGGGLFGALLGYAAPGARWKRIPLPGR